MNMKDFTEYERIRQALSQSKPVTAVQYDPDIIGAIIGQAELHQKTVGADRSCHLAVLCPDIP